MKFCITGGAAAKTLFPRECWQWGSHHLDLPSPGCLWDGVPPSPLLLRMAMWLQNVLPNPDKAWMGSGLCGRGRHGIQGSLKQYLLCTCAAKAPSGSLSFRNGCQTFLSPQLLCAPQSSRVLPLPSRPFPRPPVPWPLLSGLLWTLFQWTAILQEHISILSLSCWVNIQQKSSVKELAE